MGEFVVRKRKNRGIKILKCRNNAKYKNLVLLHFCSCVGVWVDETYISKKIPKVGFF